MAKVIAIGQPVNESEKAAIRYLRDNLPDSYTLYHNFEIAQGKEVYEIDLAIHAPHSLFIVDTKKRTGRIDIYGNKWYYEDQWKPPEHSPLLKLRQHAKVLKTTITDANPALTELRRLYTHAVVLMTATDVCVVANGSPDENQITYLDRRCLAYFQGKSHIPDRFSKDIRSFYSQIERSIRGKAAPKPNVTVYRDWQVTERKLDETDRYVEHRAKHVYFGEKAGTVRLRIYKFDSYADKETQARQLNLISKGCRGKPPSISPL